MEAGLASPQAQRQNNGLAVLFYGSICFFAGVLLLFVALAILIDDPVDAGFDGSPTDSVVELSRAVGEPIIETQVLGAHCDPNDATSSATSELKNPTALGKTQVRIAYSSAR